MSGSISAFINQYLPLAQQASAQTGLPTDFILGQAGLETGWGTSNAAVNGNNFFGISPGGNLATYATPADGFSAYANTINSPRYSGLWDVAGNGPAATAGYLQQQGYSTNPNYASGVAGAVASVDQVLGISSTGTPGQPGYSWGGGGNTDLGAQSVIMGGQIAGDGTGSLGNGPAQVFGSGLSPFGMAGTGGGSGALTWIEELAIRALLVLVGIVLIAGGLFMAGMRSRPSSDAQRVSQPVIKLGTRVSRALT